ncbi:NUDIX hydrolase [Halobacillus litoralis]|uniref:NUDIX hydrolase n=1 Tax=Halobacillus litoralis TaxID=45668 RepID=UPI00248FA9B4|nr:NUDIX hydrolase [Halobacillus litoralis]
MDYVSELRRLVGHRPLILPGAVVIIVNENGEILLQHRTDGGWGLPGGLMELGESLEQTARREVSEETGLRIGSLQLLDIFSGEDYHFKVDNGDELYSVTAVYMTKEIDGELSQNPKESIGLSFFPSDRLPSNLKKEYLDYIAPYLDLQRSEQ